MTRTLNDSVTALRAGLSGTVLTPADEGYERARRVWNAAVDRRPAVIARCATAEDVVAAVSFARDSGLEVAVRGGGHSASGSSSVDDGLVIDLRPLHDVRVDPRTRTAAVGGGALLRDLDRATQEHGLAVPSGIVSDTGVGGLTLGGGMGHLTRAAGLSIDNLLSAQMVTADGRILRASPEEHPDLFWALRGGGGNFGVVTEFVFRPHTVGPMARLALLFWELDRGGEALRLVQEVFEDLPPDLNLLVFGMNAPPAPFVPPENQGALGIAVVATGFGDPEAHAALVRRLQQALPPQWAVEEELPYTALQQFLDEPDPEARAYAYYRSTYLPELSDAVIDVVLDSLPRMNSPLSALAFYRLDGAFSAVADEETAFSGGREPGFAAFVIGDCPTMDLFAEERGWARDVAAALAPLSRAGTYVNGVSEEPGDRAEAAYGGEKYRRLARVKAAYDPTNLFHRNHNIRPAPRA